MLAVGGRLKSDHNPGRGMKVTPLEIRRSRLDDINLIAPTQPVG